MNEFILSYWWMFVLLTIVVAILTKNLIKILIFVVVFCVVFFLFWKYFVAVAMVEATTCFTNESQNIEKFYKDTITVPQGEERKKMVCDNSASSFKNLDTCLTDVSKKHPAGFLMYRAQPKFKEVLGYTVEEHNIMCKGQDITYPDFK